MNERLKDHVALTTKANRSPKKLRLLVAIPIFLLSQGGDSASPELKPVSPAGYLGNASDMNQGYAQALYPMETQKWDAPEDQCKPILAFVGKNKFAGSYQIRAIQAAEAIHERWFAPCPTSWTEICPYVRATGSPSCSCAQILNRSVFVHVKFTCTGLMKELGAAHHVWDECDTPRSQVSSLSSWDGVVVAHDLQGKAALERDARRFFSIPHHSIVHCDLMPSYSKEQWKSLPHRILSTGSKFNEAPRKEMVEWAEAYSASSGRDVKVIWEREFSTQWFNDLGLCEIYHRNNVTIGIAWQQALAPPGCFKPIERMVNPISLGVPAVLYSGHPGFQIAASAMDPKITRTVMAKSVKDLQARIRNMIENYHVWESAREESLRVAKAYSAAAVGRLYRAMYNELVYGTSGTVYSERLYGKVPGSSAKDEEEKPVKTVQKTKKKKTQQEVKENKPPSFGIERPKKNNSKKKKKTPRE